MQVKMEVAHVSLGDVTKSMILKYGVCYDELRFDWMRGEGGKTNAGCYSSFVTSKVAVLKSSKWNGLRETQ